MSVRCLPIGPDGVVNLRGLVAGVPEGRPGGPPLELTDSRAEIEAAFTRVATHAADLHAQLRAWRPFWVLLGPGTVDQPGIHLGRLWIARPRARCTSFLMRADGIEALRALLPGRLRCIPGPYIDPNIIEVWH